MEIDFSGCFSKQKKNITLSTLAKNQRAQVVSIPSSLSICRRKFMAMGVTIGSTIVMLRSASFGGPVEIAIRGVRIAIRRKDAELIGVIRE